MRKLIFIIIAFCFLGMDSISETQDEFVYTSKHKKEAIRPTMEQRVQLAETKLELQNSEIKIGLAELKYQD